MKPGQNVVIIGGAGFLGSHLAERLAKTAASLTIVDGFIDGSGANEFNLNTLPSAVKIIREKLEDISVWGKSVLNGTDVIFDLAAINSHKMSMENPQRDYQKNALPHLELARFCSGQDRAIKIVFASSRSVYGSPAHNPVTESHPTHPKDFYSLHTLLAEHYFRLSANSFLSVLNVRFSNMYGPRQRLRGNEIGLYGEMFRSALADKPLTVFDGGESVRDTIFVDDMVDALEIAGRGEWEACQTANVGGQSVSVKTFVEAVRDCCPGLRVAHQKFPPEVKAIQTGDVSLDSGWFEKKFGWTRKTNLRDGIRQTIDFYKKHGNHYL